MIATAIALQDASGNAVINLSTLMLAKEIYQSRETMSETEFQEALFNYSAHIAALATTLTTEVLLTAEQIKELTSTIAEMDAMGKDSE